MLVSVFLNNLDGCDIMKREKSGRGSEVVWEKQPVISFWELRQSRAVIPRKEGLSGLHVRLRPLKCHITCVTFSVSFSLGCAVLSYQPESSLRMATQMVILSSVIRITL